MPESHVISACSGTCSAPDSHVMRTSQSRDQCPRPSSPARGEQSIFSKFAVYLPPHLSLQVSCLEASPPSLWGKIFPSLPRRCYLSVGHLCLCSAHWRQPGRWRGLWDTHASSAPPPAGEGAGELPASPGGGRGERDVGPEDPMEQEPAW